MKISAEIVQRSDASVPRIAVKSERYYPGAADEAKMISGYRWDPNGKYWHYPLTMVTCRLLRQTYGQDLVIGPQLWDWARTEGGRLRYFQDLSAKDKCNLDLVPRLSPTIDAAMGNRPYQTVGTRFLSEAQNALIADEVSLGKTIQYLGALVEADKLAGRHLVLGTPSSLEVVWQDEIIKWADGTPYVAANKAKAKRKEIIQEFLQAPDGEASFLIINPEMLRTVMKHHCHKCQLWSGEEPGDGGDFPDIHYLDGHAEQNKIFKQDYAELFAVAWDSVIVDEAHRYLLNLSKTQVGEGMTRIRTKPDALRVAATGTPLKGKPLNFWSIFHWLDEKRFPSKWDFAGQFLVITDNGFGKAIGGVRPDREELLYEILAPIMIRRTKREVQPDLPPEDYQNHWVQMSAKQAKQYNDISEEGETALEEGTLTTTGVLAEFTRLKQWSFGTWKRVGGKFVPEESPKMDYLLEAFAERGIVAAPKKGQEDMRWVPEDGGFKHIVVSQFTSVLEFARDQLEAAGIETMMITGKVSGKKRTEVVRRFQNKDDDCRVLLLNTIAGGAALTLDAWCDEMWILDETWVRDDLVQVEGRIKNRDVEKRVAVRSFHYIRTRDTLEEEIADSGLTQDEFQQRILDERRGVTTAAKRTR